MDDSRNHRPGGEGESMVDWTREAQFTFTDEVDALSTVQELGEELRLAREQVRHITRYLQAAVIAASEQTGATPTGLINHAGVARQTIYTMLGDSRANLDSKED